MIDARHAKSLIEGKTVALVGASGSLDRLHAGHEIDSFEVVARANGVIHLNESLTPVIGSRTDFLWAHKAGFVADWDWSDTQCVTVCHEARNVPQNSVTYSQLRLPSAEILSYLTKALGMQQPTTGLLALAEILEWNPRKVKLFGFTFYRKRCPVYLKAYRNGRREEFARRVGDSDTTKHNYRREYRLVMKWMERDSRICADSILQKIIQGEAA